MSSSMYTETTITSTMLNSSPTTARPAPSAQFNAFVVYFSTSFVPIESRNFVPCFSTRMRFR